MKVDEANKENLKTKGKEGKAAEKKESKDEEEKVDADKTEGKTIVAKKKKPIQVFLWNILEIDIENHFDK